MSLDWNDPVDSNNYTPASTRGERCSICGEPAQRKVEETIFDDDPRLIMINGHKQCLFHNLTAYVCLACFNKIMGK